MFVEHMIDFGTQTPAPGAREVRRRAESTQTPEAPKPDTDYTNVRVPTLLPNGEIVMKLPNELKIQRLLQGATTPGEISSFAQSARKAELPAKDLEDFMLVLQSALQVVQENASEANGGKETSKYLKTSLETIHTESREFDCLSADKIKIMAGVLHESYQIHHKVDMPQVKQVLREYTEKNKKKKKGETRTIDLLTIPFAKLPEKWKTVNETSAKNLLLIIQTLIKPEMYPQTQQEWDALIQDEACVLAINTALYNVWSKRENTTEGKLNNPLFQLPHYQEMIDISHGKPPKEGWLSFLKKFKAFLNQNRGTYAKILEDIAQKNYDDPDSITFQTSSPPTSSGETLDQIQMLNTNNDMRISVDEIENASDEMLIGILEGWAKLELYKDKRMAMQYIVGMPRSQKK